MQHIMLSHTKQTVFTRRVIRVYFSNLAHLLRKTPPTAVFPLASASMTPFPPCAFGHTAVTALFDYLRGKSHEASLA